MASLATDESDDTTEKGKRLVTCGRNGDLELAKKLLAEGVDVNAKDKYWTALILAARRGHKDIVELLLEQENIDINAKDNYGNTALMWAAYRGHKDIAEMLLEQENIDINAKDNNGSTALISAAQEGHKEVVELLEAAEKEAAVLTLQRWARCILAKRQAHKEAEMAKKSPSSPSQSRKTYYIGEKKKELNLKRNYLQGHIEDMLVTLANVSDEEIKTGKQRSKEKEILLQGKGFLLNKRLFQGGDRTYFLSHASNLGKTDVEKKIILYRLIILEKVEFNFEKDWKNIKQNLRDCIGNNNECKVYPGDEPEAALQKIMTDFKFDNAATMMEELKQEKKRKPSLDESAIFVEGDEYELMNDLGLNVTKDDTFEGAGMLSVSTPEAPTPSKTFETEDEFDFEEEDFGGLTEDMLTNMDTVSENMSESFSELSFEDRVRRVVGEKNKKGAKTTKSSEKRNKLRTRDRDLSNSLRNLRSNKAHDENEMLRKESERKALTMSIKTETDVKEKQRYISRLAKAEAAIATLQNRIDTLDAQIGKAVNKQIEIAKELNNL
jgi:hypothetical protein